jgi:hypothetical protein
MSASTFASPFEGLELATGAEEGWPQAPSKANAPIRHEDGGDRRISGLISVAGFGLGEGERGMGISALEVTAAE